MKELLEWIEQEGYVLYKDGKWYKRGSYRLWESPKFYTHEQLIKLWEEKKK